MSYNYHNQTPNYNRPQQQPQTVNQNYQPQHQPQNQQGRPGLSDPFFNFGDDGFNMDIREDFEDPFEHMGNRMGGFGFPNIANLERQMLGRFQNEINNMHQLGQGMEEMNNNQPNNNNQMQPRNNGPSEQQQGMFMHIGGMGGPGTMLSKTYVSKIDYSGGQPHEESYQSQAIKQFGEGGHNISERQEAYKNSYTGVQKAAHQRLLDDRGTKLIKQRNVNTGEQSQHNIYKGIQENELDSFNQQYNDYRDKVHFQDNYKYLNALKPGKMMRQLGKGKEGQDNLMLGDGNEFGGYGQNNNYGNNQYQNPNQNQQQRPQGQPGQYQYNNQHMYPNQGQPGNNYQYPNQNNNFRKGY